MNFELLKYFSRKSPVTLKVSGDCMRPLLDDGAAIAVLAGDYYWPGDIVIYARADGVLVSHRALGYVPGKSGWSLLCQADNCEIHDAPVLISRVIGKAVTVNAQSFRIPLAKRIAMVFVYLGAMMSLLVRRSIGVRNTIRTR